MTLSPPPSSLASPPLSPAPHHRAGIGVLLVALSLASAAAGATPDPRPADPDRTGAIAQDAEPSAASDGAGPRPADARPWSEQRSLLGRVRWWIDPRHAATISALSLGSAALDARWAVPAGQEDGLTAEEQAALVARKTQAVREADDAGRAAGASAPPPAAGTADTGRDDDAWTLHTRITEAWRPNRWLNVLIVALPGPGAPFVTQGGAAIEAEVVDRRTGEAVAGFQCRRYAGVEQFLRAFGRAGHAQVSVEQCSRLLVQTLRDGRPPAGWLSAARGEAAADGGAAGSPDTVRTD